MSAKFAVSSPTVLSFADRKVHDNSYESLSSLFQDYAHLRNGEVGIDIEKARRILLLGKAFREEVKSSHCSLAETLYNTWLLGPTGLSFEHGGPSGGEKKEMDGPWGKGFHFNDQPNQAWVRLDWSQVGSSSTLHLSAELEKAVRELIKSQDTLPEDFRRTLKDEVRTKLKSAKSGTIGNFRSNSLSKPTLWLKESTKRMPVFDALVRESLGPLFSSAEENFAFRFVRYLTGE